MDYPTSFQAVDAVIYDPLAKSFLLGRKPNKRKIRFLGGFVDPKDSSLEHAVRREAAEEGGVNLALSDPIYIGSFRVDDYRYRHSEHKVMSAVFKMDLIFGFSTAGDDIQETLWVPSENLFKNYKKDIAKEHFPIIEMLIQKGIL